MLLVGLGARMEKEQGIAGEKIIGGVGEACGCIMLGGGVFTMLDWRVAGFRFRPVYLSAISFSSWPLHLR